MTDRRRRGPSSGSDPWPIRALGWLVAEPYRADVLGDLVEEHGSAGGRSWALGISLIRAAVATRWHQVTEAGAGVSRSNPRRGETFNWSEGSMYEQLRDDVRAAWRSLGRSPGFFAAAGLTLAVGTGATLAIFTLLSGALLSPLPYASPERLVHVQGGADGRYAVTMPVHREVFSRAASLKEAAVWQGWSQVVGRPEQRIERRSGASVSWNYFRLLGAEPAAGRFFGEEDGLPGHRPVVVLSHSGWQELFGGRSGVVGEDFVVGGEPYTIVGVAPRGFLDPVAAHVLGSSEPVSFWRADPPVFARAAEDHGWTGFWSLARMRPGVEPAHVRAEVARVMGERYPNWEDTGEWLRVASFREVATGHLRPTLAALLAAGCLVLLIACANVANLLLSRATTRSREISIRASLGASRGRLIRHLFMENLLLAAAAVLLGVGFALWATPLLSELLAGELRPGQSPRLDWKVGVFAVGLVLTTAITFGLIPALRSSEARLSSVLRLSRGPDRAGGRARGFLIGVEVALGVVVLVSAALLGRTLWNLWSTDPGFDAAGAVVTHVTLPPEFIDTPAEQNAAVAAIEREVSRLPGVDGVGIITDLPMSGAVNSTQIERPGNLETTDEVLVRAVSPGYLEAMGVPLVRGRGVRTIDGPESAAVAVINQSYAAVLPEGGLGQTVVVRGQARQVVGVVGDVVEFRLEDGTGDRVLYTPYAQEDQGWMRTGFHVVVRAAAGAPPTAGLRQAITRAHPGALMATRVRALDHYLAEHLSEYRFRAFLLGSFALIALLLAAAGIAAVTAYAVSRQTPDIGIRMALGASSGTVVREIVIRFAKISAAGLGVGLLAALGTSRFLSHFLVGVPATDPAVFALAVFLFGWVALLAAWIPARRAAAVDPTRALRAQ